MESNRGEPQVLSRCRVYPIVRGTRGQAISTPLSILDASVARFSATGAIWFYDSLPKGWQDIVNKNDWAESLCRSLRETLSQFPQWAGQLKWAAWRPDGSYLERFNRPVISSGDTSDPGVEWTVIRHPFALSSVVPNLSHRVSDSGIWIGSEFSQDPFISNTPIALHDLHEFAGLPAVSIQLNLFEGDGYALGVKIAHSLADAQSLMVFMSKWTSMNQKYLGRKPEPLTPDPVFAPTDLDTHAAGSLNETAVDPILSRQAHALPLHRYDWWDRKGGADDKSRPPPEVLHQAVISPGTRAPWETWDSSRPVTYAVIHFSGTELETMRSSARDSVGAGSQASISRLDALLSLLFRLINQSRGLASSSEDVFINMSLDVRRRVAPPLPSSFIGSPLIVMHMKATGNEACTASLGTLATRLKQDISLFNAEAIGTVLHDAAYEVSPQRLWGAFLGSRHVIATSWLRLPVFDLDFDGSGQTPRFVHQVMPKLDGLLQVMDSPAQDGGVEVGLYLDSESMEHLLNNKELRIYS
ncbi:transferase family protein [Xylariaceae sp. FL0016]|nr:transferase family protein [Xylariaceae sp. FL0016]